MDDNFEEEYLTPTTTPPTKEDLTALLKKFCFDLLQFLEQNFVFYKNILEDNEPEKKQTIAGKIASSLASAVPVYGKTIGAAIANGEIYYLRKVDKNRAVKLANLIYNYNDDKVKVRELIIEAGIEIFYCFEKQFGGVTCNGGPKRAMFKLAKDASHRIFGHFLDNDDFLTFSKDDFTRGVVFGQSLPNNFKQKKGRSLENWKTSSFFEKCGVVENDKYYGCDKINSGKYGYRRLFSWEKLEDGFREEEVKVRYNFFLKLEDLKDLVNDVRLYVMSKDVLEEAKLEREIYFQELMKKSQENNDHLLENFDDLIKLNREILENNKKE